MAACYLLEFPNGKVYVGITTKTPVERFERHCKDARTGRRNYPLYCALRKHGPESVTIHTLAESEDWAELCRYERMFIAFYGCNRRGNGYNATSGGEGVPDYNPPEEVREKMRTAARERWGREEYRAKVSAAVSDVLRINWTDPAYREKITAACRVSLGKRWDNDPAYRAKMHTSVRERWANNPNYRHKMVEVACNQKAHTLAALDASIPDYGEDAGIDAVPLDLVESVRVAVWRSPMGYKQLAKVSGVGSTTIHDFATRAKHPRDATLRRLAEALGVADDQQ